MLLHRLINIKYNELLLKLEYLTVNIIVAQILGKRIEQEYAKGKNP